MKKQLLLKNLPPLPYRTREAVNRLRVNLSYCGTRYKTIMITSSTPEEGKSFLTVNLWRSLAETGKKVLLIDADLRRSTLRSRHQIAVQDPETARGLVSYLAGQVPLQEVIYGTDIPGADMIPVFRNVSNPALLLSNQNLPEMLEKVAAEYDYILVDTPPLDSVSDALQVASCCDGALLVVRSGRTPRRLVSDSMKQLAGANCSVIGTVLNQVEEGNSSYYTRYGRYGYGYYYGNEK